MFSTTVLALSPNTSAALVVVFSQCSLCTCLCERWHPLGHLIMQVIFGSLQLGLYKNEAE